MLRLTIRQSSSEYLTLKTVNSLRSEKMSLLKLIPKTGRTHQLRIHCASIGSPIVGDKLYGEAGNVMLHKGLFLTASNLRFKHPKSGDIVNCNVPIPDKFKSLLEREERRFNRYYIQPTEG